MPFAVPAPERTAVLFIECQNGLLGDGAILPDLAGDARPAVGAMARLARGARAAGARVVHLTYAPVASGGSANRRTPLTRWLTPLVAGWHPGHPATEPIPEIGVADGDLLLPRHTGISPTYGTETFRILRNLGVGAVVLAGISLNVAVPLVAAHAADEDFDVYVAGDAVAGTPRGYAADVLHHTVAHLATICGTDELLGAWARP